MPRFMRTTITLTSGLYLLSQRKRVSDLATLVRLQRTELNYMRCELRALASLSGVSLPSRERHLHTVV